MCLKYPFDLFENISKISKYINRILDKLYYKLFKNLNMSKKLEKIDPPSLKKHYKTGKIQYLYSNLPAREIDRY